MPKAPLLRLDGHAAYIIGGGPSLKSFDFNLLRGRKTVGCNHAFRLGVDICNIVCFVDGGTGRFLEQMVDGVPTRDTIFNFPGPIVSNHFDMINEPRVHYFAATERIVADVVGQPPKLMHGSNTGVAATHLALKLGANPVYLMGIDMKSHQGQNNWHTYGELPKDQEVYNRHTDGFRVLSREYQVFYPGAQIIQLAEDSGMGLFPVESLSEHFAEVACG